MVNETGAGLRAEDAPSGGVLAGVRVVEFAQNVAIPHCGRLLAGMGAEVIKVEPPGGDAMRFLAPLAPYEGRAYAVVNQGKRSIALDLGSPGAAEVVDRLLTWADVALVAFKLEDRARFGLDWEHARKVNSRLVYLAGNAFGPEGDDAHLGGYDVLAQARSGVGFMMNRAVDGAPAATRPAINDTGTGIVSALGVVAALRHRDLTGEGQKVDTSLLGTAVSLGTPMLVRFEPDEPKFDAIRADVDIARAAGLRFDELRALYESHLNVAGGAFRLYFRTYITADGMVAVAGLSGPLFAKFHETVGVPYPSADGGDAPTLEDVVAAAEASFRERTTDEWLRVLREAGFPCGPYNLPYEALDDPQVRANDYIVDYDHPTIGRYSSSGMPVRFSAAPGPELAASPSFAAHTLDVLAELGFGNGDVERLLGDGVVLDGPPDESS